MHHDGPGEPLANQKKKKLTFEELRSNTTEHHARRTARQVGDTQLRQLTIVLTVKVDPVFKPNSSSTAKPLFPDNAGVLSKRWLQLPISADVCLRFPGHDLAERVSACFDRY